MAGFKDFFRKKVQSPPLVSTTPQQTNASKEDFISSGDWLKGLMSGAIQGIKSKFITDIYKENLMYPHEEMALAKKAYNNCSYVNSAVRTRANFMIGGKVQIESDDKKTQETAEQLAKETKLFRNPAQIGIDCIHGGNGYLERINMDGKTVNYQYVPCPERIYADLDADGFITQWVQELPEYVQTKDSVTLKYYGDKRRTVRGKAIKKDKLIQFKLGIAEIPVYGRGYVCSVLNDYRVLVEIERSIAVISRYKAIPKKLIMLNRGDDTNGGKAAEIYANQISNLSDIENPVIPEVAQVADLSYNGKDVSFEPIVNYMTKKITTPLAPSFLMHGGETNYAVSNDQRESFLLDVMADREAMAEVYENELRYLAKQRGIKLGEFKVQFGNVDLGQSETKKNYTRDLFQSNIITLDEAREVIGKSPDKENGGFYSNELGAQSAILAGSANMDDNQEVDDGRSPNNSKK